LCYSKGISLQGNVTNYTVSERASGLYKITTDIFEWSKTSDCVTPAELAQKQFEGCNSRGTVCIPGAGIGTYVVAALQAGFKPEDITAVEFDRSYYELGSAIYRRFGVNYVLADFLTWQPEMRFDVIVGNPPYQRDRKVRNVGSPLWPEFLEKSVGLVKDGGIVSLVVPFTWMQKNKRSKAWKVISENDLILLDPCVDWAFPSVDTGGITVVTLRKQSYSGETVLASGGVIDIRNETPVNNKGWTAEVFDFLRDANVVELDVKTGPINPSINSSHWSPVKTETHCYEIFYSSAKNRRSIWCDEPIGDWGKLKLAIPTYGDMYGTAKITEVGCGRQVEYVLGDREFLEELKVKLESENSKKMCHLKAYGAYHSPLKNVVW
jgi:hypothetical protein